MRYAAPGSRMPLPAGMHARSLLTAGAGSHQILQGKERMLKQGSSQPIDDDGDKERKKERENRKGFELEWSPWKWNCFSFSSCLLGFLLFSYYNLSLLPFCCCSFLQTSRHEWKSAGQEEPGAPGQG